METGGPASMSDSDNLPVWIVEATHYKDLNRDSINAAVADAKKQAASLLVVFALTEVPSNRGLDEPSSKVDSKTAMAHGRRMIEVLLRPMLIQAKAHDVPCNAAVERNDIREHGVCAAARRTGAERVYICLRKRLLSFSSSVPAMAAPWLALLPSSTLLVALTAKSPEILRGTGPSTPDFPIPRSAFITCRYTKPPTTQGSPKPALLLPTSASSDSPTKPVHRRTPSAPHSVMEESNKSPVSVHSSGGLSVGGIIVGNFYSALSTSSRLTGRHAKWRRDVDAEMEGGDKAVEEPEDNSWMEEMRACGIEILEAPEEDTADEEAQRERAREDEGSVRGFWRFLMAEESRAAEWGKVNAAAGRGKPTEGNEEPVGKKVDSGKWKTKTVDPRTGEGMSEAEGGRLKTFLPIKGSGSRDSGRADKEQVRSSPSVLVTDATGGDRIVAGNVHLEGNDTSLSRSVTLPVASACADPQGQQLDEARATSSASQEVVLAAVGSEGSREEQLKQQQDAWNSHSALPHISLPMPRAPNQREARGGVSGPMPVMPLTPTGVSPIHGTAFIQQQLMCAQAQSQFQAQLQLHAQIQIQKHLQMRQLQELQQKQQEQPQQQQQQEQDSGGEMTVAGTSTAESLQVNQEAAEGQAAVSEAMNHAYILYQYQQLEQKMRLQHQFQSQQQWLQNQIQQLQIKCQHQQLLLEDTEVQASIQLLQAQLLQQLQQQNEIRSAAMHEHGNSSNTNLPLMSSSTSSGSHLSGPYIPSPAFPTVESAEKGRQ